MLEKSANYEVQTYTCGDFVVEVVTCKEEEMLEAWLRHKGIGIAMFLFGIGGMELNDFLELVENELEDDMEYYAHIYGEE
jgi:hypothetical protein